MTLSNAFQATRSALAQNAAQSSIISRNVANSSNPNYSRKTLSIVTDAMGGAAPAAITRAADRVLLATTLESTSAASAADAKKTSLDALDTSAADPGGSQSVPSLITGLQNALQTASSNSSSAAALQAIVTSAGALADGLNAASTRVDQQRQTADSTIAADVKSINDLLKQFGATDNAIKSAAAAGTDTTDLLDARDGIVKDMSKLIGVSMVIQKDGGASLYTDGGATLYDRGARDVTFTPSPTLGPGATGAAVYVDGIPVTGTGSMASKTGAIAGLATFRDTLAPQYQSQLDSIARGLVEAFAEKDPSATPTLPDAPGLFTWSGAPGIPGLPSPVGIAGSIKLNAVVDPSQGGDSTLVRDGGIAGAGYVQNPTHAAGFTDKIQSMIDALSSTRGFDPSSGAAAGNQSVETFASASTAWLASARKTATDTATYQDSLATQATTALSNGTGVNIDDEMARMLDVEHSYQTSARLLTTIDSMYSSLLQIPVP